MTCENYSLRYEFRRTLADFHKTSKSFEIKLALCELIETMFIRGIIGRAEYQSALATLR